MWSAKGENLSKENAAHNTEKKVILNVVDIMMHRFALPDQISRAAEVPHRWHQKIFRQGTARWSFKHYHDLAASFALVSLAGPRPGLKTPIDQEN